jgi:diguanylate cyclase (GGDEF)-like protein
MKLQDLFGRDRLPRWAVLLLGFLLNAALGVVDYCTGHELVLSSFYLLPIGLVTWFGGPALGISTAVVSAGIWVTADLVDQVYPDALTLGLNSAIRLGFFLIIVYVLWTLRKTMQRLEHSSRFDNLTGSANSASLYEYLDKELERLSRYGHPLTLAYLDLDGFKEVNDGFGHLVGDRVLRVVAECVKSRLRKTDVLARLGGDEFGILYPETDEEAARAAVDEMVSRLGEEMRAGGWPVTFSIGVVTCHEAPATSEELVKMADDLMYSVKLGTKNAVQYASLGCARSDSPICDEQTLLDARRS